LDDILCYTPGDLGPWISFTLLRTVPDYIVTLVLQVLQNHIHDVQSFVSTHG
jgi:hypothetical protein